MTEEEPSTSDRVYTVQETAARVHETVKVSTVRRAIRRGELAAVKLGKRYYITESAIRDWLGYDADQA